MEALVADQSRRGAARLATRPAAQARRTRRASRAPKMKRGAPETRRKPAEATGSGPPRLTVRTKPASVANALETARQKQLGVPRRPMASSRAIPRVIGARRSRAATRRASAARARVRAHRAARSARRITASRPATKMANGERPSLARTKRASTALVRVRARQAALNAQRTTASRRARPTAPGAVPRPVAPAGLAWPVFARGRVLRARCNALATASKAVALMVPGELQKRVRTKPA